MTALAWLANRSIRDLGDTEGAKTENSDEPDTVGRHALRWKGDKSEIIRSHFDSVPLLKPGDTIVVPASYGGIHCGCFDGTSTTPVEDRAEQADLFARARPVLRLHPVVMDRLGLSLLPGDSDEARSLLGRLASRDDWPAWKTLWAEKLAYGRGSFVVSGNTPWTVIEAKRVPLAALRQVVDPNESVEDGIEVTTDGEDSFCVQRAVSLAEHCRNVEMFAREFGTRCGLGKWLIEHIALAAWLHDIGKADRRFQVMLRGGSEIEYFKDETPCAKSTMPPGARAARKLARDRSGYPSGGYLHAVQSVAMLDGKESLMAKMLKNRTDMKEPDLDLVLHLIASHHGECRPFAPLLIDDNPVEISLSGHSSTTFAEIDFWEVPSDSKLHRLDSPLADRFWGLVAKYGWQELCWLEAILRLADHRASEEEQMKEALP
jgi:CRISPR-associated endonuclease/helicase Cas3